MELQTFSAVSLCQQVDHWGSLPSVCGSLCSLLNEAEESNIDYTGGINIHGMNLNADLVQSWHQGILLIVVVVVVLVALVCTNRRA